MPTTACLVDAAAATHCCNNSDEQLLLLHVLIATDTHTSTWEPHTTRIPQRHGYRNGHLVPSSHASTVLTDMVEADACSSRTDAVQEAHWRMHMGMHTVHQSNNTERAATPAPKRTRIKAFASNLKPWKGNLAHVIAYSWRCSLLQRMLAVSPPYPHAQPYPSTVRTDWFCNG